MLRKESSGNKVNRLKLSVQMKMTQVKVRGTNAF